ncbi:DUF6221 family protein [Nocardioides sp. LS1]|uniref:DUF6221 family protein n=1 Tax=Nocardioides sp. LS1 TaxID=1027620 RepID=UPI000F61C7D7|nr:DUF6221 family protein [Nocardioides sp. LS1]GCD89919.1 hypothetical protein NLS1_19250 [Nocardioides sp. LS1]
MNTTSDDPGLLRFLQDRLRHDIGLILMNTPMFGFHVNDAAFERRFLDRSALLNRVRTDLALVALTVESMEEEQGRPPAAATSFEGGPVTGLGSEVLKLLAARYSNHPDYRPEWRTGVELPKL